MFIEILLGIGIGVVCGIITGLTPGIHVNLISIILLNLSAVLLAYTNVIVLCVFIISMSVTHSFLDAIPSVFLGAPDSDMVMNVLPGHKLLLEGKGFDAVKLTVIGSLLCLIFAVCLVPILIFSVGPIYSVLKKFIGYILICIVIFMILKDKKIKKISLNFFMFFLAGVFGLIVLNIPNLNNALFPMLSGLFGTSMLFVSLYDKINIPKQSTKETIFVDKKTIFSSISAGSFAGTLTSFFPGLGPAQGAVLASQFVRKIGNHGFMILVGGINTVNFILSLVTLFTLSKARNGAVIVVLKMFERFSYNLDIKILLVFIACVLIVGGIATLLALNLTKIFSKVMSIVNYRALVISIIILICLLVFIFSGFLGLFVLIVATMIGILPAKLNIPRNHSMGCLLLPVILFFIF